MNAAGGIVFLTVAGVLVCVSVASAVIGAVRKLAPAEPTIESIAWF